MDRPFVRGDWVHINAKKMPKSMRHFESGVDAIVVYTYADRYGENERQREGDAYFKLLQENFPYEYCLLLMTTDRVPYTWGWYPHDVLDFIPMKDDVKHVGEQILKYHKAY